MTTETTITIPVTPKLLREIAEQLEEAMENAVIGREVPSHRFYSKMGEKPFTVVKLMADQDAWHKHKAGGSPWA